MNRIPFTLTLAAALLAGSAHAQNSATVVQPTSPAPTVVQASAPAVTALPSAPVVQVPGAATADSSTPASVTQIVHTPQLPAVSELTSAAAAQGYTVERVVQTAGQTIVFYRTGSGQPLTVAYQSLPPAGTAPATAPAPAAAPAVVVTSPPPAVVYQPAPRVVYYEDYPRYYHPRVYYPPVSFHVGFGHSSFYHRGFHHQGFHHHRFRHR